MIVNVRIRLSYCAKGAVEFKKEGGLYDVPNIFIYYWYHWIFDKYNIYWLYN